MPDKRNDQIASSPKEEKRRFPNAIAYLCLFAGVGSIYMILFILLFVDLRNIECPGVSPKEGWQYWPRLVTIIV